MSKSEAVVDCWEEIADRVLVATPHDIDVTKTNAAAADDDDDNVQEKSSSSSNGSGSGGGIDNATRFDDMQAALQSALPTLLQAGDECLVGGNYNSAVATPTTPTTPAPALPPAVKILRRPSNNSAESKHNADGKPKQVFKSLQQRELEYAEARLRILGSATSPTNSTLEAGDVSTDADTATTCSTTTSVQQPPTQQTANNNNKTAAVAATTTTTATVSNSRAQPNALRPRRQAPPPAYPSSFQHTAYKNNANTQHYQTNVGGGLSQLPQHLTTYYQKYPQHAPPAFLAKAGFNQQQQQQQYMPPAYNNYYGNVPAHINQQPIWSPPSQSVNGCLPPARHMPPPPPYYQQNTTPPIYHHQQHQQQAPPPPPPYHQQAYGNSVSRLPRGPANSTQGNCNSSSGFQFRR